MRQKYKLFFTSPNRICGNSIKRWLMHQKKGKRFASLLMINAQCNLWLSA